MTKDFNQPRRHNDSQPTSRYTSSDQNNIREERPFKPVRPRLSRDAVDRAWENGANPQHADYHPRQNASRPPFQQGRPGTGNGRPQPPYNRPGYSTRPESYRGPASQANPNYQHREPGPDTSKRPFNGPDYRRSSPTPSTSYPRREQHRDDQRRPFNGPTNYRGPANYQQREQGAEDQRRPFNRPTNYRGPASNTRYQRREQEPSGERRPFNDTEYRRFSTRPNSGYQRNDAEPENDERHFSGPRSRDMDGTQPSWQGEWTQEQHGPMQSYRGNEGRYQDAQPPRFQANSPYGSALTPYRPEQGSRPLERGDRERPNFMSGKRPGTSHSQRDNHNSRWQSRPVAQRGYRPMQRYEADATHQQPYGTPTSEHFEGDYERFDTYRGTPHAEPSAHDEKHVTRMPDGRVLKGSRPAQRKQARFWNEVAEETSTLMDRTPTAPGQAEPTSKPSPAEMQAEQPAPTTPKARPTAKPKVVRTVKTNLARGTGGMKSMHGSKAKALKKKTQGPITRPSKRGYKWPTPGESGE